MNPRAMTIGELLVSVILFSVLFLGLLGYGTRVAQQRQQLTTYSDDLRQATRVADRLARAIRTANSVEARLPGSSARSDRTSLVLLNPGRTWSRFQLAGDGGGNARQLVHHLHDPQGALLSSTLWGQVGGIELKYDMSPGRKVLLVAFTITLPERNAGAPLASLSSRARVGALP